MAGRILPTLLLLLSTVACATAQEPPTERPPGAPVEAQEAQGPSLPLMCPKLTRQQVLGLLRERHGEEPAWGGFTEGERLWFEVVAGKDGNWTLLVTIVPNGPTCAVASGVKSRFVLPGTEA